MAALYTAAIGSSVQAADRGFELRWEAPAGCPLESEVDARIRSLLGAPKASDPFVRVTATVTRDRRRGLHLSLVVHSDGLSGERELDGSSCEDLAGATAVNVALLLQSFQPPHAAESVNTVAADEQAVAPSLQPPAAEAEPSGTRTPRPRRPHRGRLFLRVPLVGASIGLLPRIGAGAGLQVGLRMERWVFSVGANLWLPQNVSALDAASAGADIVRVEGLARACHTLLAGSVELAPCAGVSLEHISARGTGQHVMPEAATAAWVAIGVGLQARVELLEWLALIALVDVSWHPARPSRPGLVIEGLGKLQQLGAASAGLALGTELIL